MDIFLNPFVFCTKQKSKSALRLKKEEFIVDFIECFLSHPIPLFVSIGFRFKPNVHADLNCSIQFYFCLKQNDWELLQLIAILLVPYPAVRSPSLSTGSFAMIFSCCWLYFKPVNKSVSITLKLFCENQQPEKNMWKYIGWVYEIYKWLTKLYSSSLLLSPHL